MKKCKIIFIDIDDTLNPANEPVSDYTKMVMKRIKDLGIKIVINTGRSASYAIKKSIEAGLSEFIISSNGSEVYNYHNGEVIFSKPIANNDIKEIYDYCQEHQMTIILNSLDKRYVNHKDYKYNSEPVIYFDDINKILEKNKVNQVVILSSNYDRMLVLPSLFKEKFPSLKVVHSSIDLIEGKRKKNKEYYHDFVTLNIAKSTGIVELLEYLGIDFNEAIAIGNGYDDICICDVVGTSIAMGNANQVLKDNATLIADDVKNDGAAKILEELLLNND